MGDIDEGIAAMLDDVEETEENDSFPMNFDEGDSSESSAATAGASARAVKKAPIGDANVSDVDLSVRNFAPIEKYFEDAPNAVYNDPAYYKTTLGGEGEEAQRLHQLLVKYLNCTDPKDRPVYRQQMVSSYWNFLRSLALKVVNLKMPLCKRLAMRFGVVLPSLFSPEQKDFFSRAVLDNVTGEPVLYMDEWIREIAVGKMKPSTTDELPTKGSGSASAEQQRLQGLVGKNTGKIQSVDSIISMKESQRANMELDLKEKVLSLCEHDPIYGTEPPHYRPYSDTQKKAFSEIGNLMRTLQKLDKEICTNLKDLEEAKENINHLNELSANLSATSGTSATTVSSEDILSEMTTVRQMAKMTCGRQGNQFPVFTREFFHCMPAGTGFRENVLRELAWIESIDPNCFVRIHKNMPNRIVPYTLLVPSYGDSGFCWEPFDRYNRISSRGRIVIPMYPKDLKIACITAVGDLRWQVAKEKASFDWMSDGLTGNYYQYIESKKMKGDLKKFFIDDYILWLTKEANGTQKLEKEVRAIFWRYLPFPQETKDNLKKMSPAYQELYQRDINRSMSDGY
ncbi:MAG: hypothetical protein IJ828_08355 [Treponema sp.]|nr:hypothetical protein [Treponema sp.]